MKPNSIVSEYVSGNKWVRIGVWLFALGLVLGIAAGGGLIYLLLTDYPKVGVPVPHWMTSCLLDSGFYLVIGVCCVAYGMKPPSGGGGRRKDKKSKLAMPICVEPV